MTLRSQNIQSLRSELFDVLIIGGGINGAVSAAALAARGVRVAIIDRGDFASVTSQNSSNLVWGGIKYMEGYEFGLVAELCKSRNELMRSFPSTVREVRFLTTIPKRFRLHPLMLWAGTWIYWLFGRGFTKRPMYRSTKSIANAEPLVNVSTAAAGVEYSDAYLSDNDARFVFSFIRDALKFGGVATNYVESRKSTRDNRRGWLTEVSDTLTGETFTVRSSVVINATGPFVDELNERNGIRTDYRHVLSKGIHLLVPRLSRKERVLAFFADDGRLFFAIPMADRTCIGTTDTRVGEPMAQVTDDDRRFVLDNINARLNLETPLTREDVIAERCGVRPLAVRNDVGEKGDFLQLSRKHIIETANDERYISIFGGKLTDCLNIGNEIGEIVARLGYGSSTPVQRWYGEPGPEERSRYESRARALGLYDERAVDTDEALAVRLWRRYGQDAALMLDAIEQDRSLVEPAIEGTGIRRCELPHLARHEMIVKLDDLLRRRSKMALIMSHQELREADGLMDVCEALFGDAATTRYEEFFDTSADV
ncbi:MAG: glycerol-3-phosphate dehydrogenase/oxidase [Pseudomonadota bacterium]